MHKLASRKFLMCLAAFLVSIGMSIAGLVTKTDVVTTFGIICSTLSAAIYAACEAWTDAANGTITTVTSVTSSNTTKSTSTQLSKDLIAEAQMKAEAGDQNG